MNQGLPKSLREALARQTAGDVHPSADALTAYVEHSLAQRESQRVTDHLAQCADCREVVFLASSVVEEPVGEQELVAAAARPLSPALVAKASAPQAMASAAPARASGRRRWRLWWVWAPAVAAVLIVAGVVFQKRSEFVRTGPMTMASKAPASAPTASQEASGIAPAPEAETKYALQKPVTKPARARTDEKRSAEGRTAETITLQAHEEYPAPTVAAAPQPASPPSLAVLAGAVKSAPAAAPTHNAFVESEAQTTTAVLARPRPSTEKPQMALRAASAAHGQWRVTSDGHLERSTTPGSWTPVLADQPATFHVVSVVGNSVWAGGSGGALFHSSDSGQSWSKEPLASPAGVETSTIISIHFSDALHGVVTTDRGSRWSTSDGGASWTRE
jgi:Putative zinc-finger